MYINIISCHTYCLRGPWFVWAHSKDPLISSPLTTSKGYWERFLNQTSTGTWYFRIVVLFYVPQLCGNIHKLLSTAIRMQNSVKVIKLRLNPPRMAFNKQSNCTYKKFQTSGIESNRTWISLLTPRFIWPRVGPMNMSNIEVTSKIK